jgi:hypothetical protein
MPLFNMYACSSGHPKTMDLPLCTRCGFLKIPHRGQWYSQPMEVGFVVLGCCQPPKPAQEMVQKGASRTNLVVLKPPDALWQNQAQIWKLHEKCSNLLATKNLHWSSCQKKRKLPRSCPKPELVITHAIRLLCGSCRTPSPRPPDA